MAIFEDNQEFIVIDKVSKSANFGCAVVLMIVALGLVIFTILGLAGVIKRFDSPYIYFICFPFAILPFWLARKIMYAEALIRIIVNQRERTITEVWGAYKRENREVVKPYDDRSKVTLIRKYHGSSEGGGGAYFFHVGFDLFNPDEHDKPDKVELEEYADFFEARQFAEKMAKFCNIILEDASSGEEVVTRRPDELDMSIKESVRAGKRELKAPEIPPDMRSLVRKSGEAIVIDFPPYKMNFGCFIPLAFISVWIIVWVTKIIEYLTVSESASPNTKPYDLWISIIAAMTPLLISLFMVILVKGRRQKLTIKADSVVHEEYRIIPKKITTLPRNEIEEIVMEPKTMINSRVITLRGDRDKIEIGNTEMSEREREFLRNFLEVVLSA